MNQQFEQIIASSFSFLEKETFLLAVSGGVDSMVLLDLCRNRNLSFEVAHCNYHLRGNDSDLDQELVEKYCGQFKIKCHVKHFDMAKHTNKGQSIQLKARDLRYNWFSEIKASQNLNYIMLAHHLNDQLETLLINLSRGTGIRGLRGMSPNSNQKLRPLLTFKKEKILAWAKNENIPFREDASNANSFYKRNFLRNEVIPQLEKTQPDFWKNIEQSISILSSQEKELNAIYKEERRHLIRNNEETLISFDQLVKWQQRQIIVPVLEEFDLSAELAEQLIDLQTSENGKSVQNQSYIFLKKNDGIIIQKKSIEEPFSLIIDSEGLFVLNKFKIKCSISHSKQIIVEQNTLQFDLDKVSFPILVRNIQNGDKFKPLGMKGSKLINDYLKDKGISILEKKKTFVLETDKGIIGILNHQISDSYKITQSTVSYLEISCE